MTVCRYLAYAYDQHRDPVNYFITKQYGKNACLGLNMRKNICKLQKGSEIKFPLALLSGADFKLLTNEIS